MQHPIQVVVRRTGLTADTVRVWERRYAAVTPARGGNNERLYSEADIHRLALLRQVTDLGFRIGQVAKLPDPELEALVAEARNAAGGAPEAGDGPGATAVEAAQGCVEAFDPAGLLRVLDSAAVDLGDLGVLRDVVGPLLSRTGEQWRTAQRRMAHEHLVSATLRTWLGQLLVRAASGPTGVSSMPVLVVCSPPGQWHELGALMAGAMAAMLGWNVLYLGPSLPAEEVAFAAVRSGARAVALGITFPADDSSLIAEVRRLRERLPDGVDLVLGGAAAAAYSRHLDGLGVGLCNDLDAFAAWLDGQRGS